MQSQPGGRHETLLNAALGTHPINLPTLLGQESGHR
jgi:hypothetical protein